MFSLSSSSRVEFHIAYARPASTATWASHGGRTLHCPRAARTSQPVHELVLPVRRGTFHPRHRAENNYTTKKVASKFTSYFDTMVLG